MQFVLKRTHKRFLKDKNMHILFNDQVACGKGIKMGEVLLDKVGWLVGWVLWHTKHGRLFNAKSSLYMIRKTFCS